MNSLEMVFGRSFLLSFGLKNSMPEGLKTWLPLSLPDSTGLLIILIVSLHCPIMNFPTFCTLPLKTISSVRKILWFSMESSFPFFVYLSRTNMLKTAAVVVTRNDAKTIDQKTLGRVSFLEMMTRRMKSARKKRRTSQWTMVR